MTDKYTELAREWLGENVASEEDGGDWFYATADDLATLLRRVARGAYISVAADMSEYPDCETKEAEAVLLGLHERYAERAKELED